MTRIKAVILAGGGGTRLWPLSRGHYPKQFLAVSGEDSLLQQTLTRAQAVCNDSDARVLVVCNEEHRFLVAEQARLGGFFCDLVLEPAGRNTAPALTAAALRAQSDGDDPLLLMMPADHLIGDIDAFADSVQVAAAQAEAGAIVTFGVVPTRAETGYGYIELGAPGASDGAAECHAVLAFREKPDRQTATEFFESGRFRWNSGIFMMRASTWLQRAAEYCPAILDAARRSVDGGRQDGDFFRLDAASFEQSPSDSIDYAVMEPLSADADAVSVVSLRAGWSDVGSWHSLWQVSDADAEGNVLRGDVAAVDTRNTLVVAEHRLVATLGCDDLVVVETADAVLVARQSEAENVKAIVGWLGDREREERLTHRRVFRPWGSYESIDHGPRFQVKRITVNPGAALSLQMHHHRAEHWIVVSGTARVTCGDEVLLLAENESTYIPLGSRHRLENPGTIPLELIEVQSGSYLGEDDIVRFEDRYQRS